MSREVVFSVSRRSFIRYVLLSLLLLTACCFILYQGLLGQNALHIFAAGAGVVLFTAALVFFLRRFAGPPYSLVLKESGLWDNASEAALGLIAWEDIQSLKLGSIHSQKFIVIQVRNPDDYMSRLSPLRQKLAKANFQLTGSPVNIPLSYLDASTEDILQAIESFLNQPERLHA